RNVSETPSFGRCRQRRSFRKSRRSSGWTSRPLALSASNTKARIVMSASSARRASCFRSPLRRLSENCVISCAGATTRGAESHASGKILALALASLRNSCQVKQFLDAFPVWKALLVAKADKSVVDRNGGHRRVATALRAMGHKVSSSTIPKLLEELKYCRHSNRKTKEAGKHPD